MSEKDSAKVPGSKLKRSVIGKSLPKKRTAKLKSSSWYTNSARSIGISNKKPSERRDEAIG
jgi:hypothetical protein